MGWVRSGWGRPVMVRARRSPSQPSASASSIHRVCASATGSPDFGPARVDRGLSLDGGGFPAGGVAAFAFEERLGQHLAEGFDLGGALGEHLEQLVGDTVDLGLALHDRSPGDAIAVGELGPQDRLVQPADGLLGLLRVVAVEGHPPPVRGDDLGGDDGVGVELRVVLPRRGLLEHGHGEPGGVGELAAAAVPHPGRAPVGLEVGERGLDGDVVGVEHTFVAGQAPPQRHRLRGGEGGVVARDGADELAVLGDLVPERVPETDPGGRVEPGQEVLELVLADTGPGRPRPSACLPAQKPGTSWLFSGSR